MTTSIVITQFRTWDQDRGIYTGSGGDAHCCNVLLLWDLVLPIATRARHPSLSSSDTEMSSCATGPPRYVQEYSYPPNVYCNVTARLTTQPPTTTALYSLKTSICFSALLQRGTGVKHNCPEVAPHTAEGEGICVATTGIPTSSRYDWPGEWRPARGAMGYSRTPVYFCLDFRRRPNRYCRRRWQRGWDPDRNLPEIFPRKVQYTLKKYMLPTTMRADQSSGARSH